MDSPEQWLDGRAALVIAAAVALVGATEWSRRGRAGAALESAPSRLARAATWAFATILVAVAFFFANPHLSPDTREQRFVTITLALAAVALGVGSVRRVASNRASDRVRQATTGRSSPLPWILLPLLVLVWSFFVRFGLTEANILTDGGSGYGRLLRGLPRFSGLSVLIQVLFPASLEGMMWPSIQVPRAMAALTPALLTIVARQLGVEWRIAVFGGLVLASYPLHAAMFSSDFLAGAAPAFALSGLALVLAGLRNGGDGLLAAGVFLLAYCLWIRPDAALAVAPAALVVPLFPVRFWLRPVVIVSVAWLAATLLVYLLTLNQVLDVFSGRGVWLTGPWLVLPLDAFVDDSAILPWWIWIPVAPGLLFLRGAARWFALLGVALGVGSAHFGTPWDPTTETWMELFRYGAPAMPWMALLAGAGIVGVTEGLARSASRVLGMDREASFKLGWGLYIAAAAVVLAMPFAQRDYLSRRYQNGPDEDAFRAALRELPADCGLVVPDDEADRGEAFVRYRYIVEEERRRGVETIDPLRIVGLDAFRQARSRFGQHPSFGEIQMRRFAVAKDEDEPGCWYFYEGSYCAPGLPNFLQNRCSGFLDSQAHVTVATWPIEFWSHRLITRPNLRHAPLYDPDYVLALHRLEGD